MVGMASAVSVLLKVRKRDEGEVWVKGERGMGEGSEQRGAEAEDRPQRLSQNSTGIGNMSQPHHVPPVGAKVPRVTKIGRASCRERVSSPV